MHTIFKEFHFEAAHRLPHVLEGHRCSRLHGHSYCIQIHLTGPLTEPQGWVMDFGEIKEAFEPLHARLDHYYLNEIEGLENPTAENLARWIFDRLRPTLPQLSMIVVRETCTAGCVYTGEETKQ